MARREQRAVRRPEDWFPPVRSIDTPSTVDVDAAIAAALSAYALLVHTHSIANVTGLTAALTAKRDVGAVYAYAGSVPADAALLLVDATAGPVTVTLPAVATSANRLIHVKKIDASVNAVVIEGDGAELIDGAANQSIPAQWETYSVYCDGTAWFLI